jgi:hypothetical protein
MIKRSRLNWMGGVLLLLSACSDLSENPTSPAGLRRVMLPGEGGGGSSPCTPGAAYSATYQFENFSDYAPESEQMTVSNVFRVRVFLFDRNSCAIPANTIAASSDQSAQLKVETTSVPNEFKLTALAMGTSNPVLKLTAGGGTVTKSISVIRPSLRMNSGSVRVGSTTLMTVEAYDHRGRRMPSSAWSYRPPTWSSDNTAVATVSPTGLDQVSVRGVAPGTTMIRVQLLDATYGASVGVATVPIASITFAAQPPLGLHDTRQLTASARDANGNIISGIQFTWSVDNTAIATITSSGLLTTNGVEGYTYVRARAEGVEGSMQIHPYCAWCPPT